MILSGQLPLGALDPHHVGLSMMESGGWGEGRAERLRAVVMVKELGRGRKGPGSCGARRGTRGCYLWKEIMGGRRAVASGTHFLQPCEWLSPEP